MLQSERDAIRLSYLVEFLETLNDGRSVPYPPGPLSLEPIVARLMSAYIMTSVEDLAGRLDLGDQPPLEPFELKAGPCLPFWFTYNIQEDLLSASDGPGARPVGVTSIPFKRLREEVDRTLAVPGLRRRLVDRFQFMQDSMTWGSPGSEAGREARARALRRELSVNRFNQWLGRQDFVLEFDDRMIADFLSGEAGLRIVEGDMLGTACLCDFGMPAACQSAADLLKPLVRDADKIIDGQLTAGKLRDKHFGKVAVVFADIHKLVDLGAYVRSEEERAGRQGANLGLVARDAEGVMDFLFERLDDGIDRSCRHSRFREAEALDERVLAGLSALFWKWRLGDLAAPTALSVQDKVGGRKRVPPAPAAQTPPGGNSFVIGSLLKRAIDRKMSIEVALRETTGAEIHVRTVPFRFDGTKLLLASTESGVGPGHRGMAVSCLIVSAEKDQRFAVYSFESTILDVTSTSTGIPVLALTAPLDLATKRRKGHRHSPPAALIKEITIWDMPTPRDGGGAPAPLPEPSIVSRPGLEERLQLLDISSGGMLFEIDVAKVGGGFMLHTGQDLRLRIVLDEPRGARTVDSLLSAKVRNVMTSRDGRHRKVGVQFLEQAEIKSSGALRWLPLSQDGVWALSNWVSQRILEAGQAKYFLKKSSGPVPRP